MSSTPACSNIIVEFIGLPGVGKSTLSRAVAAELTSRGTTVDEPIHKRDSYSTPRRIASKARFAGRNLRTAPKTAHTLTRNVLHTNQQSLTDLVRVLFNLHYVAGVTTAFRPQAGVTLLDQGVFQARWSVGLRSTRPIAEAIESVDIPANLTPDLVVCVEAPNETIADRLTTRADGDTRFEPNSATFERGRNGYKTLTSLLETAPDGPHTITAKNETPESLTPTAAHVADVIQSLST